MAELLRLPPTPLLSVDTPGTKLDLGNPDQFRQAVKNVASLHRSADPVTTKAGMGWYAKAHEDVDEAIRGGTLNMRQATGMVASLSPKADWDKQNMPAFRESLTLSGADWDLVKAAAKTGKRTTELTDRLKGMRLAGATTGMLERVRQIREGQDVDAVIPRARSPKINSFAANLREPEMEKGPVTVDFRAHDIAANTMLPADWPGRGITTANLKSGRQTRYERVEDVYRTVTPMVGAQFANQVQAVTWVRGKQIETAARTKEGQVRTKGQARRGQAYV